MYTLLKAVHVTAVVLSGTGFVLRWVLMRRASPALQARALQSRTLRVAPHVIDTVLLASAVSLAVIGRFNPLVVPWLAAKITALLVYIVVGTIALRGAPSLRMPAFLVSVATFAYIVSVALSKNPWGPLAGVMQ